MDRDDQLIYEGWKNIAAAGALALGAACSPGEPDCDPNDRPIEKFPDYKMPDSDMRGIGLEPGDVEKSIADQRELERSNIQTMVDTEEFIKSRKIRGLYAQYKQLEGPHSDLVKNTILDLWEQYKKQNGINIPDHRKAFKVPLSK
jgi:hypothetical protein